MTAAPTLNEPLVTLPMCSTYAPNFCTSDTSKLAPSGPLIVPTSATCPPASAYAHVESRQRPTSSTAPSTTSMKTLPVSMTALSVAACGAPDAAAESQTYLGLSSVGGTPILFLRASVCSASITTVPPRENLPAA